LSTRPSLIIAGSPETANVKETGAWYFGGRIGYLVTPSLLTYFDGGYTQTRFTQTAEFLTATGAPSGFSWPNFTADGWFLGGGEEYALNFDWLPIQGLFWRNEYRFAEYQNRNIAEFATATGVPDGNIEHTKPYVQTITSSLVWRFNWTGH
jgi:outer membrane immunogenic protein